MTFGCAAAITIPLFIDILLDFISVKEAPYLKQRFLSTLIFAVSNVAILYWWKSPHSELILLTFFLWSYFLEFSIVISSIQALLEINRTQCAVFTAVICNGGIYAFFFGGLLSATQIDDNYLIAYISIIGLSGSSFVLLSRLYLVLKTHYQAFRSAGLSFVDWYSSASGSTKLVQIRSIGVCLQLLVLSITIFAMKQGIKFSRGIFIIDDILPVMIVRVVFFVFEYFVATRISRSQIICENHDLGFKTKLIKYFSHEMRSPLMVNIVGIELIRQSVEKMKVSGSSSPEWYVEIKDNVADIHKSCKQCLETLDFLLLYERIETESLPKELSRALVLQTLREILVTHNSVGSGARCGISLQYLKSQFNDSTQMLAVNMPCLQHVFEPALSCIVPERSQDNPVEGDSSEDLMSETIVEGSLPGKILFRIFTNNEFDPPWTILTQVSMQNPLNHAYPKKSQIPNWLHLQTTLNSEAISDTDIQVMHLRNLDFVREGYSCHL